MKNKVSIIIPFYNEEDNIPFLIQSLNLFFETEYPFTSEVIFINDGSTDKSVEALKAIDSFQFTAKLISLSKNHGSHAAIRSGILHATGDYICFMYADLQDPLSLITQMLAVCLKGNDIVWAARSNTANGLLERTFSKFYSKMMKDFAVPSYPERGFDIVMFSKKVQHNLNINIEANSSIFLQILTLGYKQSTISYDKVARKKGKSKWTLSKKLKLFIDSFIAFSYAPIRLVSIIGISCFIIGLVWSIYLVSRKLILDDLESGWPALYSTLLLGFGITNISLGIIAEYLWRTLDASRRRPVFIIDEIIELKQ